MNRIIKSAAAVAVTLGLALGFVPLGGSGGVTTLGTGSSGCCRQ